MRYWELRRDWKYTLDGAEYVIPEGFLTNGATIPSFLRIFLSPVGSMFIGSIVHDYQYLYGKCRSLDGERDLEITRKTSDEIFRCINERENVGGVLRFIVHWSLRFFGSGFWGHS